MSDPPLIAMSLKLLESQLLSGRMVSEMVERTCLVIDDVPAIQKVVNEMVEALGFLPVDAQDGAEGLIHFEQNHMPLVMVDGDLNGKVDPYQLIIKIKTLAPETVIVLFTGKERTLLEESPGSADIILHKPFGLGALQSALNPLLQPW